MSTSADQFNQNYQQFQQNSDWQDTSSYSPAQWQAWQQQEQALRAKGGGAQNCPPNLPFTGRNGQCAAKPDDCPDGMHVEGSDTNGTAHCVSGDAGGGNSGAGGQNQVAAPGGQMATTGNALQDALVNMFNKSGGAMTGQNNIGAINLAGGGMMWGNNLLNALQGGHQSQGQAAGAAGSPNAAAPPPPAATAVTRNRQQSQAQAPTQATQTTNPLTQTLSTPVTPLGQPKPAFGLGQMITDPNLAPYFKQIGLNPPQQQNPLPTVGSWWGNQNPTNNLSATLRRQYGQQPGRFWI